MGMRVEAAVLTLTPPLEDHQLALSLEGRGDERWG
jgi:hypothetical protein